MLSKKAACAVRAKLTKESTLKVQERRALEAWNAATRALIAAEDAASGPAADICGMAQEMLAVARQLERKTCAVYFAYHWEHSPKVKRKTRRAA